MNAAILLHRRVKHDQSKNYHHILKDAGLEGKKKPPTVGQTKFREDMKKLLAVR
jgi:hypothetical protein